MITISLATQADIPKINVINRICLPENYPKEIYETFFTSSRYQYLALSEETKSSVVGYLMTNKMGTTLILTSLAILPKYRNKGIGKMLLEKMLSEIKEPIVLMVRPSNTKAISLYEKTGFIFERIIKKYYKDGEDCFLMRHK